VSAQFVDALKGYEFYLSNRGLVSLEEINEFLIADGRNAISQRTYAHYRKLLAQGFRSYIPINKFDIFQALGKIQIAADRRGKSREITEVSAYVSKNRSAWVAAIILDKSPVGFGIQINERFPIRPGAPLWIRMEDYEEISSVVVWRKHTESLTLLGVRTTEYVASLVQVDEQKEAEWLKGLFSIYYGSKATKAWEDIYRVLDKATELLASTVDFLYSIDEVLECNLQLSRPRLQSMKSRFPGRVQLMIDVRVAEILLVIIEKLRVWGVDKRRQRAERGQMPLEIVNTQIEFLRRAVHPKKDAPELLVSEYIITEIQNSIMGVFGLEVFPPGLLEEGSPERGILDERILPAITELLAGDDPDVKIDVQV
jgi:hypothetical protein